jgi:glycosyltransferase involved in cell wall biosynthesis
MKVIILHYHLNPGGVTRIIESQVKGLETVAGNLEIMLLSGHEGANAGISGVPAGVHTSLYYQFPESQHIDQHEERRIIISYIKKHLTPDTILHCHNANLGKNPAFSAAIFQLAGEGYGIVNHCHDFAEDRPENFAVLENVVTGSFGIPLETLLYPNLPRYHFITLNSCDHNRILQHGIPEARVHLLANPVVINNTPVNGQLAKDRQEITKILGLEASKKICTYPVRAIRRKNIGEFLLLAAVFEKQAGFTLTQPPKNPVELPGYTRWKQFSKLIGLDVKYEAGEAVNHEMLIRVSDFCITTSYREGFGMAYLEPWITGTPVIGRNLECITEDLKQHGLVFPGLYNAVWIKSSSGFTDFKDLTTEEQEKQIVTVKENPAERNRLMSDNPFLNSLLVPVSPEIINRNRGIIEKNFTVEKYGRKLFAIYKAISG